MKIEEKLIDSLESLTNAVLEINKHFQGQVRIGFGKAHISTRASRT
jgi:hypothetical protein